MKKGHYLFAIGAVVMALASCKPMNKTYDAIDGLGKPAAGLTYTIQAADYTNVNIYASTTTVYKNKSYANIADANANIPALLNYKFFDYGDGSNASITFTPGTQNVVQPDSVGAATKYTLVNNADYLLLPGNKFADFSVAQLMSWLPNKYPNPAANEQHLLTWIFYPTIATTAPQIYPGLSIASTVSGTATTTLATGSFAYINGAWVQDYYITPAQYAAVGRGQYNQFTSADDANLVSTFNSILKADAGIMATTKPGSVQYVSFNYYSSTKVTSQRLFTMTFDGNNWVHTSAPVTLTFVKSSGKWIPDPTIFYTTVAADYATIGKTDPSLLAGATTGTTGAIGNYAQYGTFTTTTTSSSYWSPAQIDAALIVILKSEFPTPKVGIPYRITYYTYSGPTITTFATFKFDGTNWVKQ
ncbi:hypothetical protein [Mucilaginibacter jinjuensis]|uniref:DUF5017 domain-containing protein n=1 Tax=Mucilaginibacter jinjuensis TaxID=1176721 RepID=A0ABY7T2K7_9SPHI|nr:hypothetical protein [Mucilaginibacter jinjuensis]WCT10503.1 hypothetical protein PQO05_17340 [Mucilaginibacter jinjuensis]